MKILKCCLSPLSIVRKSLAGIISAALATTTFAGGLPTEPKPVKPPPPPVTHAAPVSPADAVMTGTVKGDRVNVRTAPSLSAEVIMQLRKGETVTVLETKQTSGGGTSPQEWMRIVLPERAKVYVFKDLVADGVVKAVEVNLRAGPSLEHAVIGKLKSGARVEIISTQGNWHEIRSPHTASGWVVGQYIELKPIEPIVEPRGPEPLITEAPARDVPPPITPAPAPATVAASIREGIIRVGTLMKADGAAPEGATHQLYVQGYEGRHEFTRCYIKWANPEIVVRRFESKLVRVRGREVWEYGQRFPVMEIEAIEKVW